MATIGENLSMASSFGWLDNDDEQRRRMLEVVDLFREQGTIDELGIGSIRDTLANAMFPGTSTLHTRLRYVLFLPWLMRDASHKRNPNEMGAEFRNMQYRLTESLLAGGENEGVMGNVARRNLKRLPGDVYWSALRSWGLVDATSPDAYYRRLADFRALKQRTAEPDDVDAFTALATDGIDPDLPPPAPDLLRRADFALTPHEEEYLKDRIATRTRGTLLAWLVINQPTNASGADAANFPWEIANRDELPEDLGTTVEHARRFSEIVQGAALVYNLALARRAGRDEVADRHAESLALWQDTSAPDDARSWDRADWWALITRHNPQLRSTTRDFIERWIELAGSGAELLTSDQAARLVENRERQIKGARARFVNQAALDRWSGSSGLGRLDFRWGNSIVHLRDLYAARAAA
ncbi:DUF6361 family protein [Demequina sp. SYSU T00039]|uniref:DUF6361 family protein n=1 Tax=Demequina lignilytica TaxID=3051663 RepID=A0AAW7M350_9MICO|nr:MULTISPECIES: DUF6361 family protein [unclassified Demequina]MDN4477307.1 DUF6361 family protein [Demequina sp. SYSU T00039-1]MDN4487480.1 DUF6361 family protein [Demequina sp. SYSU T00039]